MGNPICFQNIYSFIGLSLVKKCIVLTYVLKIQKKKEFVVKGLNKNKYLGSLFPDKIFSNSSLFFPSKCSNQVIEPHIKLNDFP